MAFAGVTSEHQWSSDTHMINGHHQQHNTHNDTIHTDTNYRFTYLTYLHYVCLDNKYCFLRISFTCDIKLLSVNIGQLRISPGSVMHS